MLVSFEVTTENTKKIIKQKQNIVISNVFLSVAL